MANNFRRKKMPTTAEGIIEVDYKDTRLLSGYLTESGKIVPARITGATASMQRNITEAIKRARFVALLPFCDSHG